MGCNQHACVRSRASRRLSGDAGAADGNKSAGGGPGQAFPLAFLLLSGLPGNVAHSAGMMLQTAKPPTQSGNSDKPGYV